MGVYGLGALLVAQKKGYIAAGSGSSILPKVRGYHTGASRGKTSFSSPPPSHRPRDDVMGSNPVTDKKLS